MSYKHNYKLPLNLNILKNWRSLIWHDTHTSSMLVKPFGWQSFNMQLQLQSLCHYAWQTTIHSELFHLQLRTWSIFFDFVKFLLLEYKTVGLLSQIT
jgi:hypothetical protein